VVCFLCHWGYSARDTVFGLLLQFLVTVGKVKETGNFIGTRSQSDCWPYIQQVRDVHFNSRAGLSLGNRYGAGSGRIWLDNVICLGNETSLNECTRSEPHAVNCGHSEDVSIACSYVPATTTTPALGKNFSDGAIV